MSESKPLIYAEYLSNIRQISIIAVLASVSEATTQAELSVDRKEIILHHEGKKTTLKLPGQAAPNAQLQKPALGKTELSWRIPTADQPLRAGLDGGQGIDIPWTAKSMEVGTEISCRECQAVLIKKDTIQTWKDLPSENWAEMMEFWHCHKPDDEPEGRENENGSSGHTGRHNHSTNPAEDSQKDSCEHSNSHRAYGANTKFLAAPGIGFIDITSFLISPSDCITTQLDTKDTGGQLQQLLCTTCQTEVGHIDERASGLRLLKWQLQLSSQSNTTAPCSAEKTISSTIVSCMTASCTSRLLLLPQTWVSAQRSSPSFKESSSSSLVPSSSESSSLVSSTRSSKQSQDSNMNFTKNAVKVTSTSLTQSSSQPPFLSLWILTASLRFSSHISSASSLSSNEDFSTKAIEGQLAMKVFWNTVSEQEATSLMEKEGMEEVHLPEDVIVEMKEALTTSASCLPPSARRFQNWNVGLWKRYEESA